MLLWVSFDKKPICHVQDILKQARKFLQQLQVCNLLLIAHIEL